MAGRQLPFFSLFIPAYLVVIYAGWRRMLEVWPAVLVAGATFAIGQFAVSNFVGPELTDVLAALASLTSVALLLQVWTTAQEFRESAQHVTVFAAAPRDSPSRVFRAYATYLILIATVLVGQIGNLAGLSKLKPPANVTALFKCGQAGNVLCPEPWVGPSAASSPQGLRFPVWEFSWPGAYTMQNGKPSPIVRREVPVVAASTPYALTYRLDFLAAAGTLVVIAALIAFVPMLIVGVPASAFFATAVKTGRQLKLPVVTIAFILSISTVMNYSGMTSSMALALAKTGKLFPFFAAWLGMIGVFLTGSDNLVEHVVRSAAGDDTAKLSGPRSDPDGRDERFGGRDGQDDQPAESLGGRAAEKVGVGRGRARRRNSGARDPSQPVLHVPGWRAGDAAGVCADLDGAVALDQHGRRSDGCRDPTRHLKATLRTCCPFQGG